MASVGSVSACLGMDESPAQPASGRSAFAPPTYSQDAWYDEVPGKHRICFDTWTAAKFDEALGFAGNYLRASHDGYGLEAKDVALVIVVRHKTAPFAFDDGIWAKYGKHFSARMAFVDPKTNAAPEVNVHGKTLGGLIAQGAHLAVCNLTTKAYTKIIADATGQTEDAVYAELTSHTLGHAHFAPAGIVAAARAQEHGYAIISIG